MVRVPVTDHLEHPAFDPFSAREQLLWLYLLEHPDAEHGTRALAAVLRAKQPNVAVSLRRLVAAGLLEPLHPVTRGRKAQYRAVPPRTGAS